MTGISVHFPSGAFGYSADDDALDLVMRVIGVAFGDEADWPSKYGADYENDVFMMHHYCWCERVDCPWCVGCECTADTECANCKRACDPETGEITDRAPNFLYKPTGFRVNWYKYIGRSMEIDGQPDADWIAKIFATHPTGMTWTQAIEEYDRRSKRSARAIAVMFQKLNRRHS